MVAERLDLLLSSLQMNAHLHRHVTVMHHKHLVNISLDPRNLELILLPLRPQVVDIVLQLVMMCAAISGDCLPCSISYCLLVSCSKS
jgi:hypothetical protein